MDQREIDEIGRFVATVRSGTLFQYLGLEATSSEAEVDLAIKKKRAWAQGQQSNPKFRAEAIWVIKNQALVRHALIDQRAAYLAAVVDKGKQKSLDVLNLFILGTIADGVLTDRGEDAVRAQGEALGLTPDEISTRIEALMAENKAIRGGAPDIVKAEDFQDWYALLEVPQEASLEALEQAYRTRYRWARNLADKKRAADAYRQLDAAWRDLKDPARREEYNRRWEFNQSHVQNAGPSLFLPPPPPAAPQAPPGYTPSPAAAPPRRQSASTDDEPSPHTLTTGGSRLRLREPPDTVEAPPPPVQRDTRLRDSRPTASPPPVSASSIPAVPSVAPTAAPTRTETRPTVTAAPPAPAANVGPTLGLGAAATQGRSNDGPKLEVGGPDVLRLKLGSSPQSVEIPIRNVGNRPMYGRIMADRDWVVVSPSRLDPERRETVCHVTVDPAALDRKSAVALITILTDHGERRTITFEVDRSSIPVWLLGLVALLAVVAALVVGLLAFVITRPITADDTVQHIVVRADPPNGQVFVDGELISSDGFADVSAGVVADVPIELRVELDGFATWTTTAVVPAGQALEVTAPLVLSDPMDFVTTDSMAEVGIDANKAAAALEKVRPAMEACLLDNLGDQPGLTATMQFTAVVTSAGYVQGVIWDKQNFDNPSVQPCVVRNLRAVKVSAILLGDFGLFKYSLSATVPPAGAPG